MGPLNLSPNRDMTDEETDLFIAQCRAEGRAAAGLDPADDPAAVAPDATPAAAPAEDDAPQFEPAPVRPTLQGWTAWRQRKFIEVLAHTGSVSEAAAAAGVTPRSAYRLRHREGAESFDRAWHQALLLATSRLTALAFERAIHGTPRAIWRRGEVVGEERVPSDRLLIYLLQHHDRTRYGNLSGFTAHHVPDPCEQARDALPATLRTLEDSLFPAERPSSRITVAGDPANPRDAV